MTVPNLKGATAAAVPGRHADRETLWHPREASVANAVAQYSRFVSIMKLALPAAAGALLLLVIVLPLLRQEDDRFRVGVSVNGNAGSNGLSMTNARYYGTDDKGRPYTVTAQDVRQQADNDRAVALKLPKAEITLTSGAMLSASASSGVYNRDQQLLDLAGDVALFQEEGNQLHTSSAHVQLKDGTASGKERISGQGPFGTIEASGFTFSNADKVIRFHGPARLTINSKVTPKPAETPSAKPAERPGVAP